MPLAVGTRLGPYEITGPLGVGGMGEVYRAHDSRLNRDVAIKTLPADVAADANRMARFQREAQVLAALSHPHIASIFGLEESGGVRALVMELVEGPTLGEHLAQGPLPLEEALALARQIAEALEAAHEKGIVHRDLKPANIKLTADHQIKVLDFGLAKAFDPETASGGNLTHSPTLTLEATRAGMIMGTAGYMSPEQARGKPVDKRADIWAFGVVLLEMLTGKSIFEGETVSDTLAAVLRADIDWRQLPAGTPPKVRRLLQRCLERDPKRRLRDIGDAWIEIDSPDEPAALAPPPAAASSPANRWLPWAAALLIGGAGVAWGILHYVPLPPRTPIHWTYSEKNYFLVPALSRDGSRLAVTVVNGTQLSLSLRMMDQAEAKPVPGGADMYYPEFSPDGQWIASFAANNDRSVKLKKIPATGGTAITLADVPSPLGLSWGDDDNILLAGGKGLVRVPSSGGTPQSIAVPDTKKGEVAFRTPHYLPGARAALFTIATASSAEVALLDLKTGGYRVIVNNGYDARYVPSGHLVYARGNTLFAAPFDAGRQAVTGPEAPVIEGIGTNGPNGIAAEYAFSDRGLLVYMENAGSVGSATSLAWLDRQGQLQSLSESEMWGTGRLSPDGGRVVNEIYPAGLGDGNPGDLWIFELERHTKTRLTFGGENAYPIWTPDGRHVTFGVSAAGKHGIYSLLADGSGKPELLLETEVTPAPTSWSPDGKWLLYRQSSAGKAPSIWVLPISNGVAGKPAPLHENAALEMDAQISPDGRWVAYVSAETGQSEVYLQPFPGPGGKQRVSTQGGISVRWSHDGRELFYAIRSGQGALMSVDIQTKPQLHLGLPQPLAKMMLGSTWDPAPDGKHLLVELVVGSEQGGRRMQGISDWFEELSRRVPVKR